MKRHENKGLRKRFISISRFGLRVIMMPAMLFFIAIIISCASQQGPLRERLLSSDTQVKQSAFKEFDSLSPEAKKAHIATMQNLLADKKPENRLLAADALGHMGPAAEAAVPDLVLVLSGANEDPRSHAVRALADIGPGAVPSLIKALNHEEPSVRLGAADAIGRMGPRAKAAIPSLAVMLSDRDREVSEGAATALGLIGPAAVPELVRVARRGDGYATDRAATAFSQVNLKTDACIVRELARTLGDAYEEPGVRVFSAKALGNMRENAQPVQLEMISALGDEDNDVRTAARGALGSIGPKTVPALREALKDNNARVRSGAAFALGAMGSAAEEAIPALLQEMKDDDRMVRIEAILAIGKMRSTSKAVVQALDQVLETDKDEVVRLDAARVLNKIDTPEAKEAVSKYNNKNTAR